MRQRALSVGAVGADVEKLHEALVSHGLDIPRSEAVREYFGPATREAVKTFQQRHGLPATGAVDALTMAALEATERRGTATDVSTADDRAALRGSPTVTEKRQEACRHMANRCHDLLGKLLRDEEHRAARPSVRWAPRHRGRRF